LSKARRMTPLPDRSPSNCSPKLTLASTSVFRLRCTMSISHARRSISRSAMATAIGQDLMPPSLAPKSCLRRAAQSCCRAASASTNRLTFSLAQPVHELFGGKVRRSRDRQDASALALLQPLGAGGDAIQCITDHDEVVPPRLCETSQTLASAVWTTYLESRGSYTRVSRQEQQHASLPLAPE
jgi:hypothetical protein